MKYDIKTASITYIVWIFLAYFTAAFYVWDFNPGNWDISVRDYVTMFGPVFGIFVFLTVLFWKEIIEESNPEIE
jgi:hypothetical protein